MKKYSIPGNGCIDKSRSFISWREGWKTKKGLKEVREIVRNEIYPELNLPRRSACNTGGR